MLSIVGTALLREPQAELLPREVGVPYDSLLRLYGITEEEVPQQVKASPSGWWCKPAIGRARTCCGKSLSAYLLRDESYLGKICEDGCFSKYELNVLAPAAREAKRDEDARLQAIEAARQVEEDDRRQRGYAEARAEARAVRDEVAQAREKKTTTVVGMVPLKKPPGYDDK